MTYVEGFIVAAPTASRDAYVAHAQKAAALLKEFGATRLVEGWGDDVPRGKVNDFHGAVQAREDETVLFSWIEFPDRPTRDAAHERMIADPRMEQLGDMPFDGKRMVYGGFDSVSDVGSGEGTGYIDGVVLPVPADGRDAYADFARACAAPFLDVGAVRVIDAFADDLRPGKVTDFPRAIHQQDGETVGFGWVEWPDKATRDAGWPKVMADERMAGLTAPFDGKRMIYGGFVPVLDAR